MDLNERGRRHALIVGAVGLFARLAVTAWAASRIPAAADGAYYDKVARRIAEGQGYTWLWPDGVVTYAAHYPVGYPALVALGYFLFGAKPVVAMVLNSLLGAGAAVATWSLVRRASTPRLALAAGLAVALHPALVPYTPALMTEGPTAALLVIAAALAASQRLVTTGLVLGVAVLVRPQCLVFAPILGALAVLSGTTRATAAWWMRVASSTRLGPALRARPWLRAAFGAAIVSAVALACCLPWTARNCARMERCALVSVNGGWNLAIGTQTEDGAWREIVVPDECKEVFQEAAKDECFGAVARRTILAAPGRWLAHAPAKLHATFDYFGAAPWYLHTANASAFSYDAKVALGTVETIASRVLLVAALLAMGGPWRGVVTSVVARLRRGGRGAEAGAGAMQVIAVLAAASAFTVHAWPAYVVLGVLALARGRGSLLVRFAGAVLLGTALTHAVFFGAGRYGLVVVPFVTALAFVRTAGLARGASATHPSGVDAVQAIAGPTPEGRGREESPSSTERDAG